MVDTALDGFTGALSPAQRQYVTRFLKRAGFDPGSANDDDLRELFVRLARAEEYETEVRHNGHNWELAFASVDRQDEHRSPVIDRRLRAWADSGKLVSRSDDEARWPHGKRFCLCLTHDVDAVCDWPWRDRLRQLRFLKGAPPRRSAMILGSLLKNLAGAALSTGSSCPRALDAWIEAESEHGFTSTFFFMADPIPEPTRQDALYRHTDRTEFDGRRRTVRSVMRTLVERGWEVGLHGSSRSHVSADLLREEKASVERSAGAPVTSVRQHHLFCDVRVTPRAQAQAGFLADSTFGSNMRVGFRCGTGLPFPFYDLERDEELPLLEVPLVVQDVVLSRNLAGDRALMQKTCLGLLDRVARVGGALTLLWHNAWERGSPEHECYRTVLREAAGRGAWGCSVGELAAWWRGRGGGRTRPAGEGGR